LGIGRRLGAALAAWLDSGSGGLDNGVALGNRFVDLLGADPFLAGPVRDLARRPLLLQALRSRGLARRTALAALAADLQRTYAPAVVVELLDLLETGFAETDLLPRERPELEHPQPEPGRPELERPEHQPAAEPPGTGAAFDPVAAGPGPDSAASPLGRITTAALAPARPNRGWPTPARLGREFRPLWPGFGFGALMVLVLSWCAGVLDQQLVRPWGWSAGVVLALLPIVLQIVTFGPLRRLRRAGLLSQAASGDPRRAWRWVTAPWLHRRGGEALLHGWLLWLILRATPLPLAELVLRYGLTSLACLALAALTARWLGLRQQDWGGGAGVVGALVGLAVGLSLLHWREIGFDLAGVTIPAWVLLVVVGGFELAWILPPRDFEDGAGPGLRLLASLWWWGLVLGFFWALATWGAGLVPASSQA
jgi:hypothetical protein